MPFRGVISYLRWEKLNSNEKASLLLLNRTGDERYVCGKSDIYAVIFSQIWIIFAFSCKNVCYFGRACDTIFPVDWKRGCRRADVAENSAYLKRQRKKVGDGARRKQHDERDDEYQP